MDLRRLTYFLAVVEEGSLTAAAQRLHMTQPPLSLAVSQLEKELGVRLLDRHPRGVTPTEAGQHLVTMARRLLTDADRLRDSLRAMGAGLSGDLRVGTEPIALWNLVGDRIQDFARGHTDVSVHLTDAPPGRLLDMVTRGDVEIAVMPALDPAQLAVELAPDLHTSVAASAPLVLVAPDDWHDVGPEPVLIETLLDRTWVLPMRIPGLRILPEAMDQVFARAGRRPARLVEVSTPHTGLPLVTGGLGLSVVTAGVAGQLPSLRTVEVDGGLPSLALVVIWRRDVPLTPVGKRFLSTLLPRAATQQAPRPSSS